jgi:hypothetical protein
LGNKLVIYQAYKKFLAISNNIFVGSKFLSQETRSVHCSKIKKQCSFFIHKH